MKKQVFGILMIVGAFAASSSYGQTTTPSTPAPITQSQEPKSLSDQGMRTKLSADLSNRSSQLGSNTVTWFDSGHGYYGTYAIDDVQYMTRYDKQGSFQHTYTRSEWNHGSVPSTLKTAFDQSQYKDQSVIAYWATTEPSQKGYYMEIQNNEGKISRLYADDKGNFSSQPTKAISKVKPLQ